VNRASQFGEIAWCLANLELPASGTFVEIGASDGLENSNTFELEQLGWGGLLIEPDNRSVKKLRVNRPGAVIEHCAISVIEHDEGVFFQNQEPTWSGLTENLPSIGRQTVHVRRLDTLLNQHQFGTINLLSIDTEGTELVAWRSRGKYQPHIVIVEFQTEGLPSASAAILQKMERDGYQLRHTTEVNHIFTRKPE
jgi:FkbM family methyltransferase